MTEILLRAHRATLAELRCRFGCDSPVVAIVHTPKGCICWPDQVQALCAQHAEKVDGGPVTPIVDFHKFVDAGLHDLRVTDLLEHNNALLERARAGDAKVAALEAALLAAARVGAELGRIVVERSCT